jgi:hypothetical protein
VSDSSGVLLTKCSNHPDAPRWRPVHGCMTCWMVYGYMQAMDDAIAEVEEEGQTPAEVIEAFRAALTVEPKEESK